MPESVKRRGSSGPTTGAIVRRSGLVAMAPKGTRRCVPGAPRGHPSGMSRLRLAGALLVVAAAGLAAWAGWVEPRRLVLRRRTIRLPGWPAEVDRLRVGELADLHAGAG